MQESNEQLTFITTMTFWSYTVDIFYHRRENGVFGYAYSMKDGTQFIEQSANKYRTALKAGQAALKRIERMHNEKD